MENKGQTNEIRTLPLRDRDAHSDDFVLEKNIFSNIFEKDIRRVFIYKKAERLAKAIHLITPAFASTVSLRNRLDAIAVGIVDAATLSGSASRDAMGRELLALSSVLGIARTGGLLSGMNADLIAREAHLLLQEVAAYEEPRLFLDDAPSLAEIAREAGKYGVVRAGSSEGASARPKTPTNKGQSKRHIKDTEQVSHVSHRRDAILNILSTKGPSSIKDISTVIREVSEKTIQRELVALVEEGIVEKKGERRWSVYTII